MKLDILFTMKAEQVLFAQKQTMFGTSVVWHVRLWLGTPTSYKGMLVRA